MFHFGIFTTSAPYIVMVLAYILFFATNARGNICTNTPLIVQENEEQYEYELCQKSQKNNTHEIYHFQYFDSDACLKRIKYHHLILYDKIRTRQTFNRNIPGSQYLFSALFSRPPPDCL